MARTWLAPRWMILLGLVTVAVVSAAVAAAIALSQQGIPPTGGTSPGAESTPAKTGGASTSARPTGTARPPVTAGCPRATVTVTTGSELKAALANPEPGAVIRLADGLYTGNFVATGKATAGRPITLCGGAGAVLDGGGTEDGYVLHLNRASYWIVKGFTVRNGQKGIMADETTNSLLQGISVSGTGDEAIHLRRFSSDNEVVGNTIRGAGSRKPKFGEGIYVGTAESNWCDISNCEPDRSDRNRIIGNTISGTTAECIDIKEGTSDGVLFNNTFDGSSLADADSWVDVKGRGWTIEGNTGRNSPRDGFQTHEIIDGWGTGNVFRNNLAEVNGPGLGYSLKPVRGNVVECSNRATQAGQGLSNEPCSSG
ncbi:nitrous oxide reductase family maturation protein NosD [Arthrobacter sp. ISL-5]|uniref:right-handed parallel beta-helix repeat-containing protein n=1 Tax=Arthrobacter sp. ISL-5 TaxID=2819111 RepID=UPI0020364468|nr:right-handed parallel beta-helix repeat-containing protein [Arthrobacter sp. ISL-5]